jgi:GTPase SAR1 family protein
MGIMDNVYIKRICPNCIQEFYPGDCRIMSGISAGAPPIEEAPIGWKRHFGRLNPRPIDGDLVLQLAYRECPHCQYHLPSNIERVENINIAIVGDISSGKSHYIAALIHQIRQGELQRADQYARFDCLTQEVELEYIRDVIKPLFEDRQSPPPTPPSVETERPPLIYELIMSPSPERPARRLNLILYDASGEDLAIKERMVMFSRYVFNANAIIFLADPASMPEIFNLLPPFLQKRAATGRTSSSVLNSIVHLLERYRGYEAGARLSSTPIAVTVAKSDLLKQLTTVQNQFLFLKKPAYTGTINLREMDVIDREVRQLLEDFGERTLLQATSRFSKMKFFATSATGYAPDKNGVYPAVDPCRCLDPILWILYQLEIIQA